MNYLEKSYITIFDMYTNSLSAKEFDKDLSLEKFDDFDIFLVKNVFPKMVADGGIKNDNGVLYKDFEFRTLHANVDDEIYSNYIYMKLSAWKNRPTETHEARHIEKPRFEKNAFKYFDDFARYGFLQGMPEIDMEHNFDEIMNDYVIGDEMPEYDMYECMTDYISDQMYEIDIRSNLERDLYGDDDGWCLNDIEYADIKISKEFKDFVEHLNDCPQLFAFDGDAKVYLPLIRDEDEIIAFSQLDKMLDNKFKATTNLYATKSLNYISDRDEPPVYDDDERQNFDITDYFEGTICLEDFRKYNTDIYLVGSECDIWEANMNEMIAADMEEER